MQLAIRRDQSGKSTGNEFLDDVLYGLGCKQKILYSKYFYDDAGSRLFDEICELQEYYPYRTELAMLPGICRDIAEVIQNDIDLIEFGAGSLIKVRPVLENLETIRRYVPVDIAGNHLLEASNRLRETYREKDFDIMPVEADFSMVLDLPGLEPVIAGCVRLGFFPGSTIGNFSPEQACKLLADMRRTLGTASWLLVGVDTKKSPELLKLAYNDAAGVTARFNKNLLVRINNELNGNFNLEKFDHYAFYNSESGRVEMHLVSAAGQEVEIDGNIFCFRQGESIHTENSYKYSPREFTGLAKEAGWQTRRVWQDKDELFSHHLLYAA